ncbi:hypothetical protein [Sporomusa sp.]|uniref:hypothetical protein n=1 Tax=Sporomusa sp. TaxID=2078658 RepID=UPI002D0F7BE7|nr:hypothetical protein [Sporomusa sp.]HWR08534.1 hypothetical protein [Sporomusa sp.]
MDDLKPEEYAELHQMLDKEESLAARLAQAKLTFTQANDNVERFVARITKLCTTYCLTLDNKAQFCQRLRDLIDNSPKQDMLLLFTSVLSDKGLLFDQDRTSRTTEQDISCYLTMQEQMHLLDQELSDQSRYNTRFRQLQQQNKRYNTVFSVPPPESDVDFLFHKFLSFFPADSIQARNILLNNLTLLCSLVVNNADLLLIAPLFIYQVASRHTSRLCNTADFSCQYDKLWINKDYQIIKDNGKNFKHNMVLLDFYLELCDYYNQKPGVDIELCHYYFTELSNICEWYYTQCEYNETICLPVPLVVRIAHCNVDCFENSPDFGCSQEDFDTFFDSETASNRFKNKLKKYLTAYPSVIQQYIDILSGNPEKKRYLVYQILDNADLPNKYMTPAKLPLIYTVINMFLEAEINLQTETILLQIGKKLTNSVTI